jgi:RimJ/RimL family protein N-acetyltransferase
VPYTREHAKRFIRDAMPGGWATDQEWGFAIEALDDTGAPRFAGTVTLRNAGDRRAEIAYSAHPWARGRGVVEAALRILLDWGFAERDLATVIWWAAEGNWASRKVAWRLGFSCDGTLDHWLPTRDGLVGAWVGTLGHDDQRLPQHAWLSAPVLTCDQSVLRPILDSDTARVQEACAEEQAGYFLGHLPQPFTKTDAEAFISRGDERMARGTMVHWAVADPQTDVLLASIAIFEIGGSSGAEVGYWAHPDARGRGVMVEACGAAIRHAFIAATDGGLGLAKLRLVAAVDNISSRRLAESVGFRVVGIERRGAKCRDGMHDAAIYDLVPSDLS